MWITYKIFEVSDQNIYIYIRSSGGEKISQNQLNKKYLHYA